MGVCARAALGRRSRRCWQRRCSTCRDPRGATAQRTWRPVEARVARGAAAAASALRPASCREGMRPSAFPSAVRPASARAGRRRARRGGPRCSGRAPPGASRCAARAARCPRRPQGSLRRHCCARVPRSAAGAAGAARHRPRPCRRPPARRSDRQAFLRTELWRVLRRRPRPSPPAPTFSLSACLPPPAGPGLPSCASHCPRPGPKSQPLGRAAGHRAAALELFPLLLLLLLLLLLCVLPLARAAA